MEGKSVTVEICNCLYTYLHQTHTHTHVRAREKVGNRRTCMSTIGRVMKAALEDNLLTSKLTVQCVLK
jgi:hypothetical protein